ncbi:MAG: helix-turn-helix domain-containing protein [Halalkalicoccus sp.]
MSVIAEFTVPADQFALAETLSEVPEMIVEVERVVAHEPDRIMPYFWTSNGSNELFEAAAENDPSVEDLVKLDELREAVLYRASWVQDVESVVYAYTETGAILLNATGRDDRWELELRFDSGDDVTQLKEHMDENDLTMDLSRLYHPSQPTAESMPTLTETQRETLLAALRSGYYEIPRSTQASELAEEFGISQQALSNRLRRAHRTLTESALTVTSPDNEGG